MATADRARYRILMVCTGNVCRSPAAELLLRRKLAGTDVIVRSVGTRPNVGQHVPEPLRGLLAERGLDPDPHTARYLDEAAVSGADLVLTATREHRSRVVSLVPGALRRTFTLKEFARLGTEVPRDSVVGDDPAARLRAIVAAAFRRRGGVLDASLDDLADPINEGIEVNERVLAEIDAATDVIAALALG